MDHCDKPVMWKKENEKYTFVMMHNYQNSLSCNRLHALALQEVHWLAKLLVSGSFS